MTRPLGPEEARLILIHAALPALHLEHGITARALAAIPPASFASRPLANVRSAGELARHIAVVELRFLEGAATGAFPDAPPDLAQAEDPSALAEAYAARAAPLHDRLAALDGAALLRLLDY